MPELTFKSAGVSTREIDLSGPTIQGPQGVPAGIIGTSIQGPAFVPITVATFSEFQKLFGETDGKKFGPLAVNEWLKNARACTFIRIMGAGNCQKRNGTTGRVTNAGFIAGSRVIQNNGSYGDNTYANSGIGSKLGRTFFLGCLMSESNGSTIFSSAGIQQPDGTATATVFDLADPVTTEVIGITIPVGAGGTGVQFQIGFTNGNNTGLGALGLDKLGVGILTGPVDATGAANIVDFINDGTLAGVVSAGTPTPGADYSSGVKGITASLDGTNLILTCDAKGPFGNKITITDVAGSPTIDAATLSGGKGGATTILRGILMAPSGVILSLSGNSTSIGNVPSSTQTATTSDASLAPRKGFMTGSLTLANQQFVMLLNGFNRKGGASNVITASFDLTSPAYFANVLNTDPLKIEEKGHLLYSHYDIYPTLAAVTGTGAIPNGRYSAGTTTKEDIAFLLTSSLARNADSGVSTSIPDYENFEDRFRYAASPYVITQNFGGSGDDLFRIIYLSPGAEGNTKIKVSIENIVKSSTTTYLYGTFDLVIRAFNDTDDEKVVLESFRGLSLDHNSNRFAPRVIGDQHIYFAFDNATTSQKILVAGDYPVKSNYIRLEQSSKLTSNQVPSEALPVGYRGPNHLVTSGSLLSNDNSIYAVSTKLQQMSEPPIPYRENVAIGTGIRTRADARLYWGSQFTRKVSLTEPNKVGLFESSFESYAKYFPRLGGSRTNVSVGNNQGTADVLGSVLDCDRFNNNIFSLERVRVRTGSDGYADIEHWQSASYVRQGSISINSTNKTRAWRVTDLERVGNRTYSKFTLFLQGGFEGTNLFNADQIALNNASAKREMDFTTTQGGTSGPTVAAYRKAIDIMESKSDVDIQLLAIPGMRHSAISDYAMTAVENRFDAMYIMDIEERDQFNTVITGSNQRPHVLNTVNAFKGRALDSSFSAAYFPNTVVIDPTTNSNVQVPPSVPVLGAFGLNDQLGHPWFAPAGFSRGSLKSVELAAVRLNRTNLDDLYAADINPLTAFPGTGVVVWGQKTLLASPSALDRVNVRRLLINIRRQVRNVANSLLFEPNRQETLEKFTALVNPILQRVQEQSGVDRYKVIIDTTTTTQADVENNTIRGKIFLQPTRTAEFVALDFVVTNAGSNI